MAFTGKLAKVVAVTSAIGAISLLGVAYTSKQTDIQGFIDGLKQKALAWQTQSNKNKQAYDNLKAQYDEVISLLGLDANASFDEIKAKIENLVKNTDVAGIDQTNAILKSIADSLGVTLTKDKNGLYDPQPIYDELANLQTSLDNLQSALGNTTTNEDGSITININKNADGSETYSDDMTLTQKINYLIGQINKANKEQEALSTYASKAEAEVADVTSADKAVSDEEIDKIEKEKRLAELQADVATKQANLETAVDNLDSADKVTTTGSKYNNVDDANLKADILTGNCEIRVGTYYNIHLNNEKLISLSKGDRTDAFYNAYNEWVTAKQALADYQAQQQ